jgi:hypothetical protein
MKPQTTIAQIAKMIGRELGSGVRLSEEVLAAGPILAEGGATAEIVGCLLAEAHRTHPQDRMIAAYALLLEGALATLRLQASGGDVGAEHAITEVRDRLGDALQKGGVTPEVLMLLAHAFGRAELDPGRMLQQAMMTAMEARSPPIAAALTAADISDHFAELAAALNNDPFEIYAELATTAAAFPPEHHAAMAGALAMSDSEAVREAALGFALSLDPAVSSAALVAISRQGRASIVSSKVIDRLVRMRPWLSEARRPNIDTAIRTLRPRATLPRSVERWEIRSVLASLCDGAGAQSLFALAKRGRRFALCSLLVKTEAGVADAWVRNGMTKAEADALVTEIFAGAEAVEVSIGFLEHRLADALAINVAHDVPPPFGLLQVAETLGIGSLRPESISPLALVEALIADLPPARIDTAAAVAAHRASVSWEQEFDTVTSWFEAGVAVEELLQPLRTRKRRIEAVCTRLLPARRTFWAERCAWMAAALKEGAAEGDDAWRDFALVARDLAGQRPLDEIPLVARIAAATVEAFEARKRAAA